MSMIFSKKSEAKNMADFSFCSRQIDATGPYFPWYLPLANRDTSFRQRFHPPVFCTKSLKLFVFPASTRFIQTSEKCLVFALLTDATVPYQEETFLHTGKNV